MKSCLRQWYHLSYSFHFPVSYPSQKILFLDSMKTVRKNVRKYRHPLIRNTPFLLWALTYTNMGYGVGTNHGYHYHIGSNFLAERYFPGFLLPSSSRSSMRTADQAMKTTKRRKKKMRTAKIFTMSQRLEVTDWKYLNSGVRLVCLCHHFIMTHSSRETQQFFHLAKFSSSYKNLRTQ